MGSLPQPSKHRFGVVVSCTAVLGYRVSQSFRGWLGSFGRICPGNGPGGISNVRDDTLQRNQAIQPFHRRLHAGAFLCCTRGCIRNDYGNRDRRAHRQSRRGCICLCNLVESAGIGERERLRLDRNCDNRGRWTVSSLQADTGDRSNLSRGPMDRSQRLSIRIFLSKCSWRYQQCAVYRANMHANGESGGK